MSLDSALDTLSHTALATTISQGSMSFPMLECVHVVAITLVLGTISIVDLRLLGYAAHRRGVRKLMRELLPFTWAAFGVAAVAGSLLFISNAPKYAHNFEFRAKLVLIALAGINMAMFHLTAYRRVVQWDEATPPPLAARIVGATSLCLWIAVVFMGRWVGFTLT